MALKHYRDKNVDGQTVLYTRTKTQGRPSLPYELRKPCRMIASTTQAKRDVLDAIVACGVMSETFILNSALDMWIDAHREITVQIID